MKTRNIHGGGANTNLNGKNFEGFTDLSVGIARDLVGKYEISELDMPDTKKTKVFIIKNRIGEFVGGIYQQNRLYDWLKNQGIDYSKYNSKKWMPDEAFINERNKTLYIVEKKFQATSGSVDEKVFGFPNKRRFYQRMVNELDFHVEFIFLGNSEYWDTPRMRDYIIAMREDGVRVMFDNYEYEWLGLY
ncbi:hypothetical protein BOVMAS19_18340 [Streptococcus uberis]